MTASSKFLGASLVAISLSLAAQAHAASEQQTLVNRANATIGDLKRDKEFGNAKDLVHRARAIMIVPRLYKAGFFFGGEGGGGVLMTHTADGAWSAPAFYDIGSASFGLQIGAEQSEMVIFVMSQKALDAINSDQFKIGADAGITVATLGSAVGGATTGNIGPDVVTWASSTGAYAGISLNGSVITPDKKNNAAFYGRAVTPQDILYHSTVDAAAARPLRASMSTIR